MTTEAVDAAYAFNSAGGTTTVTRTATGTYVVEFGGLVMDRGTMLVTAYGSNPASCQVSGWSESTADILCYGVAGAPHDSRFTVVYLE